VAHNIQGKVRKIRTLVEDPDLIANNRRILIETATKLFRVKGFHNTSTRDIAVKAGISVGAIYQYILTKEDLIVLILNSVVEIYEKTIYPLADTDQPVKERLHSAVEIYYRTINAHHEKTDVLYHNFSGFNHNTKNFLAEIEMRVRSIFVKIVEQGIADGSFITVNTVFVAHNIVSMGHMWALKRGRFRNLMTIDDYIFDQLKFLDAILIAPKSL
jgi:TetR/AcrR family transcriptional regulator, cholesterol catabolism regulator